jgi:hypothetical protein
MVASRALRRTAAPVHRLLVYSTALEDRKAVGQLKAEAAAAFLPRHVFKSANEAAASI